jgi:hypothetical protein
MKIFLNEKLNTDACGGGAVCQKRFLRRLALALLPVLVVPPPTPTARADQQDKTWTAQYRHSNCGMWCIARRACMPILI